MVEGDKHDNTSSSASVREQGNVSLQCPKLTETNYTMWALLKETILKAHGLWKTIDAKDEVDEKKTHTPKSEMYVFKEAIGRLTAFEEQIKSQDTLEANDPDKLLLASSNNQSHGKGRGKIFNKEAKESMKWKNSPNARGIKYKSGTKDKRTFKCYECGDFGHFTRELFQVACGINARPKDHVVNIDASDINNELAETEYVEDIYKLYKLSETEGGLRDYMDSEHDINAKML
ncbi:zinc finger, CCHC-type containing protein [Tanacetum coccineum]